MRNLLLEKDKKTLRREYLVRVSVVVFVFVFLIVLSGIIFLLPSYFFSVTKARAIAEQHAIIEHSIAVREAEASIALLSDAHEILSLLSPKKDGAALSDFITALVSARPEGLSLSEIFYTVQSDGDGAISLAGVSDTRENLLLFKRRLDESALFDTVTLPISNLAADRDLSFTITLISSF